MGARRFAGAALDLRIPCVSASNRRRLRLRRADGRPRDRDAPVLSEGRGARPPRFPVSGGALAIQAVLLWTRFESFEEAKVIFIFHVVGTIMEIFKTHVGSWVYPEHAFFPYRRRAAVHRFMYAAIGSYMMRAAWSLFDFASPIIRRSGRSARLAAAIYANFFSHHYMPDMRLALYAARASSCSTLLDLVRVHHNWRRMPILVAALLAASFIWLAENIATYARLVYPAQRDAGIWSACRSSDPGSCCRSSATRWSRWCAARSRRTPGRCWDRKRGTRSGCRVPDYSRDGASRAARSDRFARCAVQIAARCAVICRRNNGVGRPCAGRLRALDRLLARGASFGPPETRDDHAIVPRYGPSGPRIFSPLEATMRPSCP